MLAVAAFAVLMASGGCRAAPATEPPYSLPADESVARVWCESPMRKVFPSEQPPAAEGEEVVLWAARGEAEPAQIVLRPAQTLSRVHVRFGDLAGPRPLPAGHLVANFVGWIAVDEPRALGGHSGPTPDPLLPNHLEELKPGTTEPIWITAYVPRDAPPGDYAGRFWIEAEGVSLPVRLRVHVFDFALPETPTFTTLARVVGNVPAEQRPTWWRNLARHRISGEAYPASLKVQFAGQKPNLDFTPYDAAEAQYFDQFGLRLQHLPQLGLGDGATLRGNGRWAGHPVFSPEFSAMFPSYCRAMADHLRQNGWLRWTHFQFWDEPSGAGIDYCKRLAELVRAAAPDAKIYLTTPPTPDLYGLVDIWCVPLIYGYPAQACAERRRAGDQIWAYDNRLFSLDVDSSSLDLREFTWRLFSADVVGTEWWAINRWVSDPYTVPNQYPRQNGGGFFLYPPRDGDEPVNSIRWEMVREGIEDHDYLTLLAQGIDAARERLGASDAALSGKARAKALCAMVAPNVGRAASDSRVLAATRLRIAREIVFYGQQPDVVFAVQAGGIVGRAAPGTQVRIEGAEVALGSDGAFAWRGRRGARGATLEVTKGSAAKSLVVAL